MQVQSMEISPLKHVFGEVHKAIVKGDTATFQLLLDQDIFNMRDILNNLVTYNKTTSDHKLLFELPLALATSSGNSDMLISVMEMIRDMNQQDGAGNNIIHCLVLLSDEHPVVACDMYNTLISHIDHNMKLKLLTTENQEQLTALSLAAHMCVPEIMHCILNTEGVFKFEMDINGPYREVNYKFGKENNPTAVLQKICYLPEKKLNRFTDSGILHTSPLHDIRNSINRKSRCMFNSSIMSTIALIIGYAAYLRFYLQFGKLPDQGFSVLAVVLFVVQFLEFLRTSYVNRKTISDWGRKLLSKNPPTIIFSMHTSSMLAFFAFFAIAVIDLAHPYCDNNMKLRHILHGITSFFAVGCLASLFHAFPRIAYLMAVVQKMFEETIAFTVMGFLSYAAFAAIVYILETPFQCFDSVTANDTTYNPQDLPGTMYNAFLRLLHIKTPDDVYFSESQVPAMSIAVYVFAVIIWPVMLLNFLIALYNEKMKTVTQHREVITVVQNMNIMLFAHDTYYVPYQKVKKRIYKLIGFDRASDEDEVTVYTLEQLLK